MHSQALAGKSFLEGASSAVVKMTSNSSSMSYTRKFFFAFTHFWVVLAVNFVGSFPCNCSEHTKRILRERDLLPTLPLYLEGFSGFFNIFLSLFFLFFFFPPVFFLLFLLLPFLSFPQFC
eukprot:m.70343 g.70343  ORF g.70343 m.70343 type:complete len:120 (+) comp35685_c0_seq2:606-965(+)